MDDEEEQAAALEKATATYTEHARQFRDFERVRLQLHTPSPLIDTDPCPHYQGARGRTNSVHLDSLPRQVPRIQRCEKA
jgi:hypothetical protein